MQVQAPSFSVGQNPSSANAVATAAGYELADFPDRALLFGLTSTGQCELFNSAFELCMVRKCVLSAWREVIGSGVRG